MTPPPTATRRARALLLLGLCWLAAGRAAAQTSGTWAKDANGNYGTAGNWTGGVPNGGGVATFGGAITADRTVTVDISPTLSGLVFANTSSLGAYTLSPSSSSFILTAGATVTNTAPVGTTVNVPITLQGNLTFTGG